MHSFPQYHQHRAVEWGHRSPEARREALTAQYAAIFQDPRALEVVNYKERNWAEEPWVGGCYSAVPEISVLTNYPWREVLCKPLQFPPPPSPPTAKVPKAEEGIEQLTTQHSSSMEGTPDHDRHHLSAKDNVEEAAVFIAGTEAARTSVGYVDGAIESGSRAAENVLALLRGECPKDELSVPAESPLMKEVLMPVTWNEKALSAVHRRLLSPIIRLISAPFSLLSSSLASSSIIVAAVAAGIYYYYSP